MKIIKRNGSEAVFDISKIIAAVTKANNVVASNQRLTKEQITAIADDVAQECQSRNHAMNVEEIQDLVEDAIMQTKAYEVARKYITYRYVQSLRRTHNTTDDRILSLIECNNEEVKQENANKNPTVNSVQRDYMAGEVSKDLTMRMLWPPYWLDATCAMIWVAMLQAVEKECGFSMRVPEITVPFCSMSSRLTRSQLCICWA